MGIEAFPANSIFSKSNKPSPTSVAEVFRDLVTIQLGFSLPVHRGKEAFARRCQVPHQTICSNSLAICLSSHRVLKRVASSPSLEGELCSITPKLNVVQVTL